MVPHPVCIITTKNLVTTKPSAADLQPRPQMPLSTVPPMSVRACANHAHPPKGRRPAHRASAPCPPAHSPKPRFSPPRQRGYNDNNNNALVYEGHVRLTLSTSRAMPPRSSARSTSPSASLVNAIFALSSLVLPFTRGSSAAVHAAATAASLSLSPAFTTASLSLSPTFTTASASTSAKGTSAFASGGCRTALSVSSLA